MAVGRQARNGWQSKSHKASLARSVLVETEWLTEGNTASTIKQSRRVPVLRIPKANKGIKGLKQREN